MPAKKVLLWDCLCLVPAFISFHVAGDLASVSSSPSLSPTGVGFWPSEMLWFGLGAQAGRAEDRGSGRLAQEPRVPCGSGTHLWGLRLAFQSDEKRGSTRLPRLQERKQMLLLSVLFRWGFPQAAGQFDTGFNSSCTAGVPWRSQCQPPPHSPSCL